jgi:hypothetical protein
MSFVHPMVDSPGKVMGGALISPLSGPMSCKFGKTPVNAEAVFVVKLVIFWQ